MKSDHRGFSIVDLLIVVIVVVLIAVIGWLAYDKMGKGGAEDQINNQQNQGQQEKSAPYNFEQLGVSMDVLDGWSVKTNHTQQEGANFYEWTVEKADADGKISFKSNGFKGGFYGCSESGDPLTVATVKDVVPTQNPGLVFMHWSYDSGGKTNNNVGIVLADEAVFRAVNDSSAAGIPNKDVSAGEYFFCLSEPKAGFSLGLNNEASPGFSRTDSISALASDSSGASLSDNAQSYADIKAMLTTIK